MAAGSDQVFLVNKDRIAFKIEGLINLA